MTTALARRETTALAPDVTIPRPVQAMVPANLSEAMNLATMMAKCSLVPQALQNKPADCLLVIEQAARWNMSPFAVAQCASVIKGKLMFEGKLVAAAINSSGALAGRLNYAYSGTGNDRTVTVSGTLRGEAEPVEVQVRLADARTDNEQWRKQPDQQLAYHGSRVWARRHCPEVMLGVYAPEEFSAPAPAAQAEAIVTPRNPAGKPATVTTQAKPAGVWPTDAEPPGGWQGATGSDELQDDPFPPGSAEPSLPLPEQERPEPVIKHGADRSRGIDWERPIDGADRNRLMGRATAWAGSRDDALAHIEALCLKQGRRDAEGNVTSKTIKKGELDAFLWHLERQIKANQPPDEGGSDADH